MKLNIFSHCRNLGISFFFKLYIGKQSWCHCDSYWHLVILLRSNKIFRRNGAISDLYSDSWIFHVVSELPTRSALFGIKADWSQTLLKAWAEKDDFVRWGLNKSLSKYLLYFVWYMAALWNLHIYFLEELFYVIGCKFGLLPLVSKKAECQQLYWKIQNIIHRHPINRIV